MLAPSRLEQLVAGILAREDLSDDEKRQLILAAKERYLPEQGSEAPPEGRRGVGELFKSWDELLSFIASRRLSEEEASQLKQEFIAQRGLPSAFSQFWKGVASWPTSMATIIPGIQYLASSAIEPFARSEEGKARIAEKKKKALEEIALYERQRRRVFQPAVEEISQIPGESVGETLERAIVYGAERLGALAPDALLMAVGGVGAAKLAARSAASRVGVMATEAAGQAAIKAGVKKAALAAEAAAGSVLGQREAAHILSVANELGEEEPSALVAEVAGLASGLLQALPARILPTSQAARDMIAHAVFGVRSKPYLSKVVVPKALEVARGAGLGAAGGAGSSAINAIALDVLLDRAPLAGEDALNAAVKGLQEGAAVGALVGFFSPTGAQYARLKPEVEAPASHQTPFPARKPIKLPKGLPQVEGRFATEREITGGIDQIIGDQLKELKALREEVPQPEVPEDFISPLRARIGRLLSERYPVYKLGEYVEKKLGQTALGRAIRDAADNFNFVTARTQTVLEKGLGILQDELAKVADVLGERYSHDEAVAAVGAYGMLRRIAEDPFAPVVVRFAPKDRKKVVARVKRFTGIEPVVHFSSDTEVVAFVPRKAMEFAKIAELVERVEENIFGEIGDLLKQKFPGGNMAGGNPYKLNAYEAQKLLDDMRQKSPEIYAASERAFERLNDLRRSVLAYVRDRGWISDQDFEALANNTSYATFVLSPDDIQDSLVEAYISPAIKRRTGWAGSVRNPYVMTVAKLASLMETAERNELATATVVGLGELGLVERAKPLPGGRFEEPRNPAWKLIRVRANGKEFGYYIPAEFAEAVSSGDPTPAGVVKVARALGNVTHALWIRYSPRFAVMNPLRDLRDTITRNPELQTAKGMKVLLEERIKARKEAKAFVRFGVRTPDIARLVEEGIVPPEGIARPSSLNALADIVKKVVPEPDAPPRTAIERVGDLLERAAEAVDALMSPIPEMISTSEVASKLAGYRALKRLGVSGRELEYRVRNMVGTPNFMRRGSWALVTNALWPFSTVKLQGMRATYEALQNAPGRVSRYLLIASGIPAVVRWGLASGAALALYNHLTESGKLPDNEVTRNALEAATAIAERQTSYNLANYDGFPVAMIGDKGLWVRIPMGYAEQIFSSAIYNILDAVYFNELYNIGTAASGVAQSAFKTFAGEVPAVHPLIAAAADLTLLALNVNPPDIFAGGHSIPRHIFEAGGPLRWKYQLTKELRGTLGTFAEWAKMPDPVVEAQIDLLRNFQDVPGIGNALGSFVRISNFGITEKIRRMQEAFRGEQTAEYERARQFVTNLASRDVPVYEVVREAIQKGIIPRKGRQLDWREVDWLIKVYARSLIYMSPFARAVMMSRTVSNPEARALMISEASGLLE